MLRRELIAREIQSHSIHNLSENSVINIRVLSLVFESEIGEFTIIIIIILFFLVFLFLLLFVEEEVGVDYFGVLREVGFYVLAFFGNGEIE